MQNWELSVARIESGTNYTIQVLVDGTLSGQTYSKPYIMSVQQADFCLYGDQANSRLYWGMSSTAANHVFIFGDELGYMTAIPETTCLLLCSGNTSTISGSEIRMGYCG